MFRFSARTRSLLIALCVMVVTLRVGGAHLHYCFDGGEPPVTVHLQQDIGLHHLQGDSSGGFIGGSHSDVDVDFADAVAKKPDLSGNLTDFLLLVALVIFFVPFVRPVLLGLPSPLVLAPRWANFQPPSRGPPR